MNDTSDRKKGLGAVTRITGIATCLSVILGIGISVRQVGHMFEQKKKHDDSTLNMLRLQALPQIQQILNDDLV